MPASTSALWYPNFSDNGKCKDPELGVHVHAIFLRRNLRSESGTKAARPVEPDKTVPNALHCRRLDLIRGKDVSIREAAVGNSS